MCTALLNFDFHKKVKSWSLYTSFKLRGLAWDTNKAVTFSNYKEISVMLCHFKEFTKLTLYCSLKSTQPFIMIVIILCISMLMILNIILVQSLLPIQSSISIYHIDTHEISGSFQRRKISYSVKIQFLSFTCGDIKVVMATSVSANRKIPSQHCMCFKVLKNN